MWGRILGKSWEDNRPGGESPPSDGRSPIDLGLWTLHNPAGLEMGGGRVGLCRSLDVY